jgi:hypothetical protein
VANSVEPIDHGTLVEWVSSAEEATAESREVSEKCRHYYDSRQWTDAEAKALKKRKQAATVINRIKPKMDGLMGMEKSNKTTAKAYPRTPKHDKAAEASTEAIRSVLQDQFYDQKRSSAWDNILLEGTGGAEVTIRKRDLKIVINQIPWDRIIYDPHSRRKDFSDARWLGQVVWMDLDEALEEYPDAKDVLEVLPSGSQTYDDKPKWYDSVRKRVKIVEVYYHYKGDVWYSCFTRSGYVKPPKISPFKNEEGETEWPYEFASAFVGMDGDRYGAAYQLLDLQDDLNKRRSKFQHLLSVRQVRSERGAVEDVNKARQELAKPDGWIETTPGMEFEVLKTGDMAAAQFNLYQDSKTEIDAISFNAANSGKDTQDMSGIALQRRQLAGQTELAPLFDVLKHMDIRVYRKVWNRIRQYWKDEKWIRVTDDEQNLRWVGLNAPITKGQQLLQQAQERGLPPEQLQQLEQQIAADPMMKEVVDTQNDIADLDVDIIIDDAPDVLTTQIEDFQVLGEMVKSGFQMPPEAVILASPLSHKDRIIKMMKQSQQVPPQVQEQMQKMQEEGQKLAEENKALKEAAQADQAKAAADARAQMADLELRRQVQAAEIQLAREKADAEIALKRAIAEADYEIEQRKLNQQNEHASQKLKFDQECRLKDEATEAEATAIPKTVESMEKMTEVFANLDAMLQKQTQIQEATLGVQQNLLEAVTRQKKVSISGVQKNASGQITGATVTTH